MKTLEDVTKAYFEIDRRDKNARVDFLRNISDELLFPFLQWSIDYERYLCKKLEEKLRGQTN